MLFADDRAEKRFLILLSLIVGILLYFLYTISPALEGGMDSYNHYLMARYSWEHPILFLDYWGKPIYTLLASPWAQLGLDGLLFFNILCLLGSAWFIYLAGFNYGLKHTYLVFVLALFSPIFLDNVLSGLTEPLNAFLLSLVLYFLSNRKFILGALLAGLLPYARTEGFVIIAVIGFYLLFIERKYLAVVCLLVGSLFFNLLGWIISGEALWIITGNPYLKVGFGDSPLYGSGPIWYYARWTHVLFGLVNSVLAATGIAILTIGYLKDVRDKQMSSLFYLVSMVFVAYFFAHSLVWWQGWIGSAGLIRVMLVVSPLAALLAVKGFEYLLQKAPVRYQTILVLLLIGNTMYAPFRYYAYKYPLQLSAEQEEFNRMLQWLESQDYSDRTWAYMYPYLSMVTDRDPWDRSEHEELWYTSLPYYSKGTILIWDAHFGANEAGIPLDTLIQSPDYKLLKSFKPQQEFKTLNDHPFEIYVFEKLSESKS